MNGIVLEIVDKDSNEYGAAVYFHIKYCGQIINDEEHPCTLSAWAFDNFARQLNAEIKEVV